MYIIIDKYTTKTCIKLMRGLCGDKHVVTGDVYMLISSKACPTECKRKQIWTGCQWEWTDEIIEPKPVLRYDAIEIAADGSACFVWDNLLMQQPLGQYTAELYVCGNLVGRVTLVLTNHTSVDGAVNIRIPNCDGC